MIVTTFDYVGAITFSNQITMIDVINNAVKNIMGESWDLHSDTIISKENEGIIDVKIVLRDKHNPDKLYDSRYKIYTNHNIDHQISMMVLNIYYRDIQEREKFD